MYRKAIKIEAYRAIYQNLQLVGPTSFHALLCDDGVLGEVVIARRTVIVHDTREDFALVLEKIPSQLAKKVAQQLSIPVIGIGAGADVDGQVLVIHDLIGLTNEFNPRFLRRYMNLYEDMKKAIEKYVSDVKSVDFPNQNEQY